MILKKRIAAVLLAGVSVAVTAAEAQYAQPQWGSGMYGAMQPCPYPQQVGNGAQSYLDGYREVQKAINLQEDAIEDLEDRRDHMIEIIEEATQVINGTVESKYADQILEHMSMQRTCSEYQKTATPGPTAQAQVQTQVQTQVTTQVEEKKETVRIEEAKPAPQANQREPESDKDRKLREARERAAAKRQNELKENPSRKNAPKTGEKGAGASILDTDIDSTNRAPASSDENSEGSEGMVSRAPAAADDTPNGEMIPIRGFTEQQWFVQVCQRNKKGGINPVVCHAAPYSIRGKKAGSDGDCRKALLTITNGTADLEKFEREIASAKRKLESLEKSAGRRSGRRLRSGTESGFCAACEEYAANARQRAQYIGLGVAAFGAVSMVMDHRANKRSDELYQRNQLEYAKNNAALDTSLGYQARPLPIFPSPAGINSGGAMLVAGGLTGALSGGVGSGAYGCATGLNGTGNANGAMGIAGPYGQGPGLYPPVYGQTSAFGYPANMYGVPQGGAMYMPGQGPWGPNGPYALNGNQGPILAAPGNPYGLGQNGAIPYGAVVGVDAYGNRIYSQGGVPGVMGQNGVYSPYGNGVGPGGFATGPYPYQGVPGAVGGTCPGYGCQAGYPGMNGAGGVNPFALQNGQAAAITQQGLNAEAMNLQNRMYALNAGGMANSGYAQYSQYSGAYGQYGTGFNQYGAVGLTQYGGTGIQGYGAVQYSSPGYVYPQYSGANLTGSLTIGGTFNSQPSSGAIVVPAGTR